MRAVMVLFFLCGCSTVNPRFSAVGSGTTEGGAYYAIPVTEPHGSIRLRSAGVVDLRPKDKDKPIPALHIRCTLSNSGGKTAWTFDPRQQQALFPDQGQVSAVFVNSDASAKSELKVRPGESRTVDLYFVLPDGSAAAMTEFNVKWVVQVGDPEKGVLASQTTTFLRQREMPVNRTIYPYESYGVGFGPMWWHYYSPTTIIQ